MFHCNRLSISSCFRNTGPKTHWGHDLDLSWSRDVIDHVTIRFPIRGFIGVPLEPSPYIQAFEIFGSKYIGVTNWPFGVTSRHWSCDNLMPHLAFPIGVQLYPTLYLQPFSRYWALNILGSRPWPFKITWRHRSRDDSIPHIGFPIGAPLEPSPNQNWANFGGFGGLGSGVSKSFDFYSKRHMCSWIHVVWAILRRNRSRGVTSRSVGEKIKSQRLP